MMKENCLFSYDPLNVYHYDFFIKYLSIIFFYCFAVIYLLHTINTTAAAAAAAIFNEIIPIFPSDSLQNQWGF